MNIILENWLSLKRPWNKAYLMSRISPERYASILRGNLLISAGSLIAVMETLISIYLGLHHVPYKQTLIISIIVFVTNAGFIATPYIIKNYLVLHELILFGIYLLFFLFAFSAWTYRLSGLRLLALINALTTITILLSYTSFIQSFMISTGILICYYSVTWYSIKIAGQPGSLLKETFFSFCLIPAFILISSAASYINKKRKDLEKVKNELQLLNNNLIEVNDKLLKEQMLSEIEMSLASEIQNAIFPGKAPAISDWDIAFRTKPYGAVSGDFYDFYSEDNFLKGISLFDVSGHGVAPALITILAKPVFYNQFNRCKLTKLGDALESANSVLQEELEAVNLYITGIMLRMNQSEVEYVNAGHPDLLHFKSKAKKVHVITDSLNSFKGHPVGINLSREKYKSLGFTVPSGDFLILYSDGLTESKNNDGEQFGLSRLSDAIESSDGITADSLLEHIMNTINDFTGDIKAGDDITIIVAGKI